MTQPDDGEEEDRLLRARLDSLSGALEKKRRKSPPRPDATNGGGSSGKFGSAMGLGLRAASEFAAAIVVGSFIGWRLDAWLGTKPAFTIIFFLLGVAAGIWNVIRVTSPQRPAPPLAGQAAPARRGQDAPSGANETPAGVDEDED